MIQQAKCPSIVRAVLSSKETRPMLFYIEATIATITGLAVLALFEKMVEHGGHVHLWEKWTGWL